MTIKKQMSIKRPDAGAGAAAPSSAAAAIADRYRLDSSAAPAKRSGGGSVVTLAMAIVALVVAGILTFVLYQHWEFLKGA